MAQAFWDFALVLYGQLVHNNFMNEMFSSSLQNCLFQLLVKQCPDYLCAALLMEESNYVYHVWLVKD